MISQQTQKSKKFSGVQAESITVKLFISDDGTDKERVAAAGKMLRRCNPVSVDKEVFFLEGFNILD